MPILGLHHVNETVPREQWIYWDLGFLIWGAAMLLAGWLLLRSGQRETGSLQREQARASDPKVDSTFGI